MNDRKRKQHEKQPQQQEAVDPAQAAAKLKEAQDKLAHMEATNRICFRLRADFAKIEDELKQFSYSQAELDHILEPKGTKNIPGFAYFEIQSQRQFVARLSSRTSSADGHGAVAKQDRQRVDELVG